jgi:N-acetylglucosamine-6-phosphate deacetylase
VIVAAGHTDAAYEEVCTAIDEGLRGFTHLYNAMTQLNSRAPGAVGAALDSRETWCGIIADGHHVHPAALRIALAAIGPDRLALVTDAMPSVGADTAPLRLGDILIKAEGGRLTGPDGTLAGSSLDMAAAVRNAQTLMHVDLATAVYMASAAPARAIGLDQERGSIRPGLSADLVLLTQAGEVAATWIGGVRS